MYKGLIRPLLFNFDPESVHHFAVSSLKFSFKIPGVKSLVSSMYKNNDNKLKRRVMGIDFPNPIGLAAGFDKDAKLIEELDALGFGFIEIGTITPKGQPGNPRPRLFRLKKDKGVINRMGFNNEGVDKALSRLRHRDPSVIVGGNIGKNKITPNEKAKDDYIICFNALFDHVDYFVVNVSSPNTPGLRDLQEKEPLIDLLSSLQKINNSKSNRKPLTLKIAPDLTDSQLDDIVEIAKTVQLDAVIATNTTISREGLLTKKEVVDKMGAGGLSGAPVRKRSTEVVKYLRSKLPKNIAIIAVGGVFNGKDALEKIEAGADLVQIYTGFIYEGPAIVKNINKELIKAL